MGDNCVNALWIGKYLSPVELLCIKSFLANGHTFKLWIYEKLLTQVPDGTILKNAGDIIPHDKVFTYKATDQYGHGKGSYAGFSDIFRYKLLYQYGGWWTDMDVVCLKPLSFSEPYVFRTHHDFNVVGNIMKCPPLSPLMNDCYNEAVIAVTPYNTNWNLPIEILNNNIIKHDLKPFIKDISNPDKWLTVRQFMLYNKNVQPHWLVLHLMNEEWRKNNIDKNALPRFSAAGKLFKKYKLDMPAPLYKVMRNYFRILLPAGALAYLFWKMMPRLNVKCIKSAK